MLIRVVGYSLLAADSGADNTKATGYSSLAADSGAENAMAVGYSSLAADSCADNAKAVGIDNNFSIISLLFILYAYWKFQNQKRKIHS